LACTCWKVSRRATAAWHKKNICKKSLTQSNCGPWKEVTATGIKITRCAGHRRMGQIEDSVEQETPKRTEKNRCWKYPECNRGIRYRGLKQRLRVRKQMKDRTTNAIGGCRSGQQSHLGRGGMRKMIFHETVGRKTVKQIAGSSVGLRQDKDWTLWRGRPPPKWKK
jgi:hypothetical protein